MRQIEGKQPDCDQTPVGVLALVGHGLKALTPQSADGAFKQALVTGLLPLSLALRHRLGAGFNSATLMGRIEACNACGQAQVDGKFQCNLRSLDSAALLARMTAEQATRCLACARANAIGAELGCHDAPVWQASPAGQALHRCNQAPAASALAALQHGANPVSRRLAHHRLHPVATHCARHVQQPRRRSNGLRGGNTAPRKALHWGWVHNAFQLGIVGEVHRGPASVQLQASSH